MRLHLSVSCRHFTILVTMSAFDDDDVPLAVPARRGKPKSWVPTVSNAAANDKAKKTAISKEVKKIAESIQSRL